jgi:hypothetical protein
MVLWHRKGRGTGYVHQDENVHHEQRNLLPHIPGRRFFCVYSRSGEEHSERKSSIPPDRPSIDPLMIR